MGVWDSMRAELEEQRCLIEQQQVTIQRQQSKIDLQFQLTAQLQADLDRIALTLQRASTASASLRPRLRRARATVNQRVMTDRR